MAKTNHDGRPDMTNPNDPWASPADGDDPNTGSFPPQHAPGQTPIQQMPFQQAQQAGFPQGWGMPAQAVAERKGTSPVVIVVITVLALALMAVLGWVGVSFYQNSASGKDDVVVTSVVVAPAAEQPPAAPAVAPAAAPEVQSAPVAAPSWSRYCGSSGGYSVYAGTGVTSCPFAYNVASAMSYAHGSSSSQSVRVYSPVTGSYYSMYCGVRATGNFECTGGDNAQVFLVP